ncbi:MAG: type IX secretion system membrane protein PorP/SprF [Chitinophagales bacterium]
MSRKKMLYHWMVAGMLFSAGQLHAQTQPLFDQYQFNQMIFNPAYCGSRQALETSFFLHRQSVRMDGAPSTESLTAHMPLFNDKVGLGIKAFHDNIGVTNKEYFAIDYAYRMHLNNDLVFSIGLEGSITNYNVRYTDLEAYATGDPAFSGNESFWVPNAGAGIYFAGAKYYIGLSSLGLLAQDAYTGEIPDTSVVSFEQIRHIYLTTGFLIDITDKVALKPSFLLKLSEYTPAQLDANLGVVFNNTFMLGGGYRTNGSVSVTGEYILHAGNGIKDHEFGLGYSFNTMLGNASTYFGPSHEVYIVYRFYNQHPDIKNPRFF